MKPERIQSESLAASPRPAGSQTGLFLALDFEVPEKAHTFMAYAVQTAKAKGQPIVCSIGIGNHLVILFPGDTVRAEGLVVWLESAYAAWNPCDESVADVVVA